MQDEWIIPATLGSNGKPLNAPSRVVRLKTPTVTPEELIAECMPPEPYTPEKALHCSRIALHELLRVELEGFPYRDQLTHPRAVWARVMAVTLAGILSVQPPIEGSAV